MITEVAILDTVFIVLVILVKVTGSYLLNALREELHRLAVLKELRLKELDAVLSQRMSLDAVRQHCLDRRVQEIEEREAPSAIQRLYQAKEARLSSLADRRRRLLGELQHSVRQEREATDVGMRSVHEKRRRAAEEQLEQVDEEIQHVEERPVEEPEVADRDPEPEVGDFLDS